MARFFKPQKKKSIDTKHKAMTVERLDHQGDGVAFEGKKPVFIAGALPGEDVLVQLTEDKRQFARARLMKVVSPSAERIKPFCQHYRTCGGCNLQHLGHEAQIAAKQQTLSQLMKKFASADLAQDAPVVSAETGYRRRARLSVKISKTGELEMGFRQRSSNDIVTVTDCPVLNTELNALLPDLYTLLDGLRGRRIVGHVELVASDAGRVLLVRTTKKLHEDDVLRLTAFAEQSGLIFYLQQEDDAASRVCGEQPFYSLGNQALAFEPQDFIQVNADINEKMIAQALEWLALDENDTVLDLFCGLGNFSLPLAAQVKSVVGIEGVEEMVSRATDNAARNALSNARFYHANLELDPAETVWGKESHNKILLDPARAGALGVMPYVAQSGAERVVYVSCNPATLARDSQVLLENGYKLARLGMLDMFPHTGHLESMALFVKD
ncbi:23S rRNA (uracil(1939)-C(5))-methyltransferase RlmD [Enterovibrio paralichthyis]|uniref:23S rRNA (uracil(1939)-C(5))-methyltransferase RlmD n=1 Tax=Enterovibrio paralichthyis TaxID=2853805 RepID=UPI001C476EBB|nr:23S rRNA (uracil(1939)-C(5))-methyltransferase RlmD [Enterovibrio paralichthyis]MBV7297781.1 23S rRNA (uracil(1939)-C(5))-methyltransferase RlmD [Enterovibrio paralichthyis]